jgi:hypothetical protein
VDGLTAPFTDPVRKARDPGPVFGSGVNPGGSGNGPRKRGYRGGDLPGLRGFKTVSGEKPGFRGKKPGTRGYPFLPGVNPPGKRGYRVYGGGGFTGLGGGVFKTPPVSG